ncbi:MAG: hypothetical protein MUE82_00965 [Chloroflexi bacterium]|nr:hypothetical protein [Chloroflexota bacterium]
MDDDLAQPRTSDDTAPLIAAAPVPPPDRPGPAAIDGASDAGPPPASRAAPSDGAAAPTNGSGATASQLRRFIKSRPWVPMHELRRRFGIEGPEDDMAPVDVGAVRIFVGLPAREAGLLGDLIRQGEVGYELVHDPDCPAIAGVYPMRPVVRT